MDVQCIPINQLFCHLSYYFEKYLAINFFGRGVGVMVSRLPCKQKVKGSIQATATDISVKN